MASAWRGIALPSNDTGVWWQGGGRRFWRRAPNPPLPRVRARARSHAGSFSDLSTPTLRIATSFPDRCREPVPPELSPRHTFASALEPSDSRTMVTLSEPGAGHTFVPE